MCKLCNDGYRLIGDTCKFCNDGYRLNGDTCIECTCPNGQPQAAAQCTKDGVMCKLCNERYGLNGDACEIECSCPNGQPQTGAQCTKDRVMCKLCNNGYSLVGDTCEETYSLSEFNAASCPYGFSNLGSENACREGSSMLGLDYMYIGAWVGYPPGCMVSWASRVYWNPNSGGAGRNYWRLICKKKA